MAFVVPIRHIGRRMDARYRTSKIQQLVEAFDLDGLKAFIETMEVKKKTAVG
jgi:hypothetical protein